MAAMQGIFKKQNFQCNRYCGECCKKLVVEVTPSEIKKIKSLGCKEEDFLVKDFFGEGKNVLKRDKNGCIFLKKEEYGRYSCKIYENRPKICKDYPFFNGNGVKSCLPQDMYPNVFFKFNKTKHLND